MIKLGNTNIKDVKLGNSQVKKVYQGTNLVWQKYSSFAVPLLDLDFQNNFTDKTGNYTMIQGQGLPTFELSGRKPGEYSAVFNGSQSIRTQNNLDLNSDKVTVSFWMKTTYGSTAIVTELSGNFTTNNAFVVLVGDSNPNKLVLGDRAGSYNLVNSNQDVNTNSFIHVIATIDRSQGVNQNKIYINGVLSSIQNPNFTSDNNGNFGIDAFYIGQRIGNSYGFIGSLIGLKVYNQVPTDAQALEIYQNEI